MLLVIKTLDIKRYMSVKIYLHILAEISAYSLEFEMYGQPCFFHEMYGSHFCHPSIHTCRVLPYVITSSSSKFNKSIENNNTIFELNINP